MSLTLEIKYRPHKGQLNFHESQARFRILACGRRWGKTICGANEAIKRATLAPSHSVGFCVAPTYWHTQKQWREFLLHIPRQLIVNVNRAERCITLLGNRLVWFKSADNPDSLRSEGLDWLWMDEGAQIKEEAWTLALRPALMDKHGIAWFTGTPKGKNWYFRLWTRGTDKQQGDYESWQYPTQNNPYIDSDEVDVFRRDMPPLAYQQEVMAQFIDEVGSLFRNIRSHIAGSLETPQKGRSYSTGCDVAKYEDFTVLCTLDMDGHVCGWDRFQQVDWVLQRKRIVNHCKLFDSRLLIDSTGVGDPIYDELRREQLRVEGYKFTTGSKADLIDNLTIMLDNNQITYPEIPELINELELYGYETLPSGTKRYRAPEGYHDDCVTALALAAWQLRSSGPLDVGRGKVPW